MVCYLSVESVLRTYLALLAICFYSKGRLDPLWCPEARYTRLAWLG